MSNYRERVDTSECHFCPRRDSIEVHHIVPQRFEGSNRKENLVAVCERCHEKLEALYDKRFYQKLGIEDEKGSRESHIECVVNRCSERAAFRVRKPQFGASHYRCMEHAAETLEDSNVSRERMENYVTPVSSATIDALVSEIKKQRFSELKSIGGGSE
jgi:predicted metal-dependent TIM-barrel fold hydrolase